MVRVLVARGQLRPERVVGHAYVFAAPRDVERLKRKRARDKRTKRKPKP
jgi:hypothetical protein